MAKIRVLLVDDHAVLRAGLRMLINAQPDMEVCAEAASGPDAVSKVAEARPNVITLDVSMPGGSGIKMIERLRQGCPEARILVLTMHDDPAYVRAALAAGSSGYVVKTAADTELLTAIRAVHRGRMFVDLDVSDSQIETILGSPNKSGRGGSMNPLSDREREVLEQLAQGHTNQAVADRLSLSVKTVETYRARIGDKLGLKSRADMVRYAMETGLLDGQKHRDEAKPV
jgi:two-component system, NarL family, response regulator NreC